MTDRERAVQYIAIFVNVGDEWRNYIPLDGDLTETGVRIGSVELWPDEDDGSWWLWDGVKKSQYALREVPS